VTSSKPIIGIVGAIGSGKSLVATELVNSGGQLVAADPFGHEALRQSDNIDRIRRRWGTGVINEDGSINRRQLGARVFAAADERRELEAIVFPYIEKRIEEECTRAQQNPAARFIVFDAAIMLEARWNRICTWVLFVHCCRPVRLARLASSRGLTEAEVEARENAQWPLLDKLLGSDDLIDNSGTAEQTSARVQRLLRFLNW